MSKTENCGCKIIHSVISDAITKMSIGRNEYIAYCPLHAAAPKMLEALKKTNDLHSTYKLKADHYDCGKWISEIRDILEEIK